MRFLPPDTFKGDAGKMLKLHQGLGKGIQHLHIHATFGTSFEVMLELWYLLHPKETIFKSAHPWHLLWALPTLKSSPQKQS
jgi:hypothetical protein